MGSIENETAAGTGAAVRVHGLAKRFADTVAVAGVDLDVPDGSFFGLVGPNGAGKTTLLSMITGLLRPDAGSAVVAGVDVWADPVAAKTRMGVVQDTPALFDRLSGTELLAFHGALRRLDPTPCESAPRSSCGCSTSPSTPTGSWSTTAWG